MPSATASRIRAYLDDLDRALSDLPKDRRTEIVRDIRGHIDVALSERTDPSSAEVEQLLEELGTPAEIAEAAYAELPPPRTKMAGRDVATVVLLLIGSFLFLIGWVVGLVLLWTSTAWRTKDKVIGTLLVPGGLFAPLFLLFIGGFAVASTQECTMSGPVSAAGPAGAAGQVGAAGQAVSHCTSSGVGTVGQTVFVAVLVVSVVGPIFSMAWLIRTARRVS